MSQAYKEGLFGSKYVWIIVGWYLEDWWTKTDEECAGENLLEAASNLILTSPLLLGNSTQPTISKKVEVFTFFTGPKLLHMLSEKTCTAVPYQNPDMNLKSLESSVNLCLPFIISYSDN